MIHTIIACKRATLIPYPVPSQLLACSVALYIPSTSISLALASFPISTLKCHSALFPCPNMSADGFRCPAAAGPSQRNGRLRFKESEKDTHSSILDIAVSYEREVPRERE